MKPMIDDEMLQLDSYLATCGQALCFYIYRLHQESNFENWTKKGDQWVFEPNFVTFSIHWKQAQNLTIYLRGNPHEFVERAELPLRPAMAGYSRCTMTSPEHLLAAASYIERSYILWSRGRTRDQKQPKVVEV